jgi:hypothetical protein
MPPAEPEAEGGGGTSLCFTFSCFLSGFWFRNSGFTRLLSTADSSNTRRSDDFAGVAVGQGVVGAAAEGVGDQPDGDAEMPDADNAETRESGLLFAGFFSFFIFFVDFDRDLVFAIEPAAQVD